MTPRETRDQLGIARRLAETGKHRELVQYLDDGDEQQLRESQTLALLYGTSLARLGHLDQGAAWVEVALELARERGDRAVEIRALNVRGAIELDSGRIERAASHFKEALAEADREGDNGTVGRCSTNLGIINNMRGQRDQAVASYTMALTAFQKASLPWGMVVAYHNLGITYRDKEEFGKALEMADRAMQEATHVGNVALEAQTLAGHAEIRVLSGDPQVGRREIERALGTHAQLGDVVGEAEDERILAGALVALGDAALAETTLRTVVERGTEHGRPLLVATARRDLAHILFNSGRSEAAREAAYTARSEFHQLGCVAETDAIDNLLALIG